MTWNKENLLDISDFSREDLKGLFKLAEIFEKYAKKSDDGYKPLDICRGEILMNVFFEKSTRTRGSFQAAMLRLGGNVSNFEPDVSALGKGESEDDTLYILNDQCDIFVIRHGVEFSVMKFSEAIKNPVINGGDGKNQHPTQTILDLYTIQKEFGKIDDLKIALVGDLKYGRTVHSLSTALNIFDDVKVFGISPEGLEMPEKYKNCEMAGTEMSKLDDVLAEIKPDVVYATRIQKERMPEEADVKKYEYVINEATLSKLPEKCIVMHPLPRVNELQIPRFGKKSRMFEQAFYGIPTRMAIIATLLGHEADSLKL